LCSFFKLHESQHFKHSPVKEYNYNGSFTVLGMRGPREGVSSKMGDRKNFNEQFVGSL
jgi:hypothetical protein